MKRYVITMPRTTFIVAALAMTALTLGASIAPARMDSPAHASVTVAYAPVEESTATEVAIVPARIEVVSAREPRTLFTAVRQLLTRKPQST